MSELLDIGANPPFDPYIVHGRELITEVVGEMALRRILLELPTSAAAPEALALTAAPAEAKRVVDTIPFLRALSDSLANVIDNLQLSEAAYLLGGCLSAITLDYATVDCGNSAVFDDSLREQAEELEKTKARQYRPEDRMDVLLQAMSMLEGDMRMRTAETFAEELDNKVDAAGLPQAAEWAGQHLRQLSDASGATYGAAHNPWGEGLIDADNEFEALRGILDHSSFAAAMFRLIDTETMSDSGEPPNVQFVAGINRTLAFLAVGTERLAAE